MVSVGEPFSLLSEIVLVLNTLKAAGTYTVEGTRAVQRAVRNLMSVRATGLLAGVEERLACELMQVDTGETVVTTVAGTRHPRWHARGHPADRLAQTFLAKAMKAEAFIDKTGLAGSRADVLPAEFSGDVMVLGSPVSNELTKIALDYLGRGYRLVRSSDPALMELRWTFLVDAPQTVAKLSHFSSNTGPPGSRYSVRNWQLWDSAKDASLGARIEEGRATNDYLLVTRLRNFLTPKAFSAHRTLLLVGGTHGLGTVGFGRLLEDAPQLRQLIAAVGDSDFQAVVEVGDPRPISWKGSTPRDDDWLYDHFPRTCKIVDVETLSIRDETYLHAQSRVEPRLRRYYRDYVSRTRG